MQSEPAQQMVAALTNHTETFKFSPLVQLRRERIAERIRALQEIVPSVNKVSFFSYCFINLLLKLIAYLQYVLGEIRNKYFFLILELYPQMNVVLSLVWQEKDLKINWFLFKVI